MAYDERDRLTDATNAPLWGGTHTFVYDPLDNIRRTINPTFGDWTYVYNASTQRLDRIDPSGTRALISYGYDTRGRATARTTSGAAQTFTIDLADRVKAVNPSVATYRYDGFGRRTSITKGSTTTVQVYSPAGQLMYQSSPSASDGIFRSGFQSGDTPYPPAGGGNKRYIYLGPHLVAEDGTAGRSYIHTDGLGSPARTSNSAGTPSGREDYKPYGWGPVPQSTPSFTGHVADAETGLLYMQARYYDPFAGRFLATDPVEASAAAFNRYWYANNNPYRYIDPDGRCPKNLGSNICVESTVPLKGNPADVKLDSKEEKYATSHSGISSVNSKGEPAERFKAVAEDSKGNLVSRDLKNAEKQETDAGYSAKDGLNKCLQMC